MNGPEHVIELFHGYTYSAHPLACAAGLATLDLYRDEGLFERAKKLEPVWAQAAMSLKGLPNVLDIRTVGLTVGIDLAAAPTPSASAASRRWSAASTTRASCSASSATRIAVSPPLIVREAQIGEIFDKVGKIIKAVA